MVHPKEECGSKKRKECFKFGIVRLQNKTLNEFVVGNMFIAALILVDQNILFEFVITC